MKKFNFTQFELFVDIEKTKSLVRDMHKEIANMIYVNFIGLAAHALALKIYNADGEIELDEDECKILLECAEVAASPSLIDSIREVLK